MLSSIVTCLFVIDPQSSINNYLFGLFNITKAAITPGTQPQSHNKKTIIIEPQPLSRTASGGQKIERRTLQILIILMFLRTTLS